MEAQEHIRILELAAELVQAKKPATDETTEATIEEWHKLFDKAYKAIAKTLREE